MFLVNDLISGDKFTHKEILNKTIVDLLLGIEQYIDSYSQNEFVNNSPKFPMGKDVYIGDKVIFGQNVTIEKGVVIRGHAIIGDNTLIKANSYIRENVIIGNDCTIGYNVEIKNSVLLDGVQIAHFNYVGDSILGEDVHLGAGAKISNYRLDGKNISIKYGGKKIDLGINKFGAIIGSKTEIGCNTVINVGSIIGNKCVIYPNLFFRGSIDNNAIVKNMTEIAIIAKK